jgi:hypothetical protein
MPKLSRVSHYEGCGHTGRDSEPERGNDRAKVTAFIRVAEIRGARVEEKRKNCPDCTKVKEPAGV